MASPTLREMCEILKSKQVQKVYAFIDEMLDNTRTGSLLAIGEFGLFASNKHQTINDIERAIRATDELLRDLPTHLARYQRDHPEHTLSEEKTRAEITRRRDMLVASKRSRFFEELKKAATVGTQLDTMMSDRIETTTPLIQPIAVDSEVYQMHTKNQVKNSPAFTESVETMDNPLTKDEQRKKCQTDDSMMAALLNRMANIETIDINDEVYQKHVDLDRDESPECPMLSTLLSKMGVERKSQIDENQDDEMMAALLNRMNSSPAELDIETKIASEAATYKAAVASINLEPEVYKFNAASINLEPEVYESHARYAANLTYAPIRKYDDVNLTHAPKHSHLKKRRVPKRKSEILHLPQINDELDQLLVSNFLSDGYQAYFAEENEKLQNAERLVAERMKNNAFAVEDTAHQESCVNAALANLAQASVSNTLYPIDVETQDNPTLTSQLELLECLHSKRSAARTQLQHVLLELRDAAVSGNISVNFIRLSEDIISVLTTYELSIVNSINVARDMPYQERYDNTTADYIKFKKLDTIKQKLATHATNIRALTNDINDLQPSITLEQSRQPPARTLGSKEILTNYKLNTLL